MEREFCKRQLLYVAQRSSCCFIQDSLDQCPMQINTNQNPCVVSITASLDPGPGLKILKAAKVLFLSETLSHY